MLDKIHGHTHLLYTLSAVQVSSLPWTKYIHTHTPLVYTYCLPANSDSDAMLCSQSYQVQVSSQPWTKYIHTHLLYTLSAAQVSSQPGQNTYIHTSCIHLVLYRLAASPGQNTCTHLLYTLSAVYVSSQPWRKYTPLVNT